MARPDADEPTYREIFWRPYPSFYIEGASDTYATRALVDAVSAELFDGIKQIVGMEDDEASSIADNRLFGDLMDWQGMIESIDGCFFTHLDARGFSVNVGVHPAGLRLNDFSILSYAGSGT